MMFRLLTTGSRTWTDVHVLKDVLDAIAQEAVDAGGTGLIVIHGAHKPPRDQTTGKYPARSADWLVHLWATLVPHPLAVEVEPHPAYWNRPCRPGCPPQHRRNRSDGMSTYCPLAGHYRNQEMVESGFDHAVAFWMDRQRGGTSDCIERIRKANDDPDVLTIVEQHSR